MTRLQHVCPDKGCRSYALGGDDEQEGAQHHRKRGDVSRAGTYARRLRKKPAAARCWAVFVSSLGGFCCRRYHLFNFGRLPPFREIIALPDFCCDGLPNADSYYIEISMRARARAVCVTRSLKGIQTAGHEAWLFPTRQFSSVQFRHGPPALTRQIWRPGQPRNLSVSAHARRDEAVFS
jgi:hypothetical protein